MPKEEETIDLISDDEDLPSATVNKSLPPPDNSRPDRPEDLTVQSSQASGMPQPTNSLSRSQHGSQLHVRVTGLSPCPQGVVSSPAGPSGPGSSLPRLGQGVAKPPAGNLPVSTAALTQLAGTINQWGNSMSSLSDVIAMNLNARAALNSTLQDLTKSFDSWASTLAKGNESASLPQLVKPESQVTNESSRPPSSLR